MFVNELRIVFFSHFIERLKFLSNQSLQLCDNLKCDVFLVVILLEDILDLWSLSYL